MSSNKNLSTLAKNIRKLRGEKNISQDKLSKLAGIAHNTIIKIETGLIKNPKIETVQNIADAFGISLDELTK
ncbi:MAG: Transcriptional regulator, Cro/CI family [Parcubacteria group bacterium GW2011_GWA2_46_7]|nr:MAG: Transcriptional regulator, Cro/CI family [Parcubacteria group bacterium GW2011_GWF1_45_5]KKU10271.1 MAG: Transcriptional regulator, Cro/CI family [Parcubacteria group bacterium GW2011_GWA1_45_7]KKU43093.1 MAG: Transcriptional regulator, Cro/CI family [Parcubacteria group bacterium GW2011_GWA2_46_7]